MDHVPCGPDAHGEAAEGLEAEAAPGAGGLATAVGVTEGGTSTTWTTRSRRTRSSCWGGSGRGIGDKDIKGVMLSVAIGDMDS